MLFELSAHITLTKLLRKGNKMIMVIKQIWGEIKFT
jgi:hypothetical protein